MALTLVRGANPQGEMNIGRGPAATCAVVIGAGGTVSETMDCRGFVPTHVSLPSGFDGTSLKPQGSMDGATFYDIFEHDDIDGSAVTLTVAAGRIYALPVQEMLGLSYIRFAAEAQTNAVTLTVTLA